MRHAISIVILGVLASACADEGPGEQDTDGLLQVEPLPPLDADWSLSFQRKIGSPAPDPTGIAYDGTQLWLISGGHNADTHTLYRYDDRNYAVTRMFVLPGLIELLGTGVYGLAWDGTHVWISVSGNRNKLVAVDPNTGAVVRTWASPATLGPSDLSFDSQLMWIGDGTGTVFSMSLVTGEVLSSFSVSPAFVRDDGIVALTEQILVNGLFGEGLALFTTGGELISRNSLVAGPMCIARNQLLTLEGSQIVYYDLQ